MSWPPLPHAREENSFAQGVQRGSFVCVMRKKKRVWREVELTHELERTSSTIGKSVVSCVANTDTDGHPTQKHQQQKTNRRSSYSLYKKTLESTRMVIRFLTPVDRLCKAYTTKH